jgi:hypothetical protein
MVELPVESCHGLLVFDQVVGNSEFIVRMQNVGSSVSAAPLGV